MGEPTIDVELVGALLAEQHPDLADRAIERVAQGWDNALFRIGADLVARLPIRQLGADLVAHEHDWLPRLAPVLPLAIPVPLRTGQPGAGYRWHWSICAWLPGSDALDQAPVDLHATAAALASFITAMQVTDPADAPSNAFRGHDLAVRDEITRTRCAAVANEIEAAGISATTTLACWEELCSAPRWEGAPMLLHGDLHPGNLLVHEGALHAVVDFGDLTTGDPATDLSVAWTLLDDASRDTFRAELPHVDEATWVRAQAWALSLALAYVEGAHRDQRIGRLGLATLRTIVQDWSRA